ncbi:MAG: phospholipase D-like domain-containing protein [Pirellulales bacterium]
MDIFAYIRPISAGLIGITLSVVASIHVISTKREVRAAIGWMGLIWLVPFGGAALYAVMGVNRITRRGDRIRRQMHSLHLGSTIPPMAFGAHREAPPLPAKPGSQAAPSIPISSLAGLERTGREVTGLPLVDGNRIELLIDGDEAYPAMLAAIRAARRSIGLSTYIFDIDEAGAPFVEALANAVQRGVQVRVLIDAVGGLYSSPPAPKLLEARGIPTACFLKSLLPWRAPYLNLRNHRKILVADGSTGFTGGINIRARCLAAASDSRIRDLHFRLEGPVVSHLATSFASDWVFTTGEHLEGNDWFPRLNPRGNLEARGISDGPDEDFEALRWTLLGALASAEHCVRIVTPYFLPDRTLVAALNLAALRGVTVDIVVPEHNNLRVVGWAMLGQIRQVLKFGCRVWLTPAPFDHSKLFIVDHSWTLFGSGNWDPRSLRLNFEFNVEAYDTAFAARAEAVVWQKIGRARRLTIDEVDGWPMKERIRNGLAWLGSPYL